MMPRRAVLFTLPTVGHVNHGIALGGLLEAAGFGVDLVTGSAARSHLEALPAPGRIRLEPSYDLVFDKRIPGRTSHFRQIYHAEHFDAAALTARRIIAEVAPSIVVTKDFVAPRVAALEAGIPCLEYQTDGLEPLLAARDLGRGVLSDEEREAFRSSLRALGCGEWFDALMAAPDPKQPNLIRGFAETSLGSIGDEAREAWRFLGFLTYDGPPERVEAWRRRLAGLRRPLVFVSFGTVLYSAEPYRLIMDTAARLDAAVVVASPNIAPDECGPIPDNVLLASYVPNEAALSVADLVIHHGGYGTILSALEHAVPSVVVPQNVRTSAQGLHGRMLENLGIGRCLSEVRSGDELAAAASSLLDVRHRQRARELARQLRARSAELHEQVMAWLAHTYS